MIRSVIKKGNILVWWYVWMTHDMNEFTGVFFREKDGSVFTLQHIRYIILDGVALRNASAVFFRNYLHTGSVISKKLALKNTERGALGLTLRFCSFLFRSSLGKLFFAWLHSSCGMAHQPVELSGRLVTKPCVRPSAPLCRCRGEK